MLFVVLRGLFGFLFLYLVFEGVRGLVCVYRRFMYVRREIRSLLLIGF